MKRSHQFNEAPYWPSKGISGNVSIHEAGHAAAIVLGNKRKGLPPVFFQVLITPQVEKTPVDKYLLKPGSAFIAEVDGGCLIPILPSSFKEVTLDFSPEQKLSYQRAFEADMVNLLVGPLAEAKYIANNDGESFNPLLVNLYSLYYYGGTGDLIFFRPACVFFLVIASPMPQDLTPTGDYRTTGDYRAGMRGIEAGLRPFGRAGMVDQRISRLIFNSANSWSASKIRLISFCPSIMSARVDLISGLVA